MEGVLIMYLITRDRPGVALGLKFWQFCQDLSG
jgi:hypothetical protein